jgi:predicted TIM-barrel fold metal-dependent hydrolase
MPNVLPNRIISADCHINEPPHVFDNVPAKLKPRAPKMLRGADGGDGWSFDGAPPKRTFGIEATAGRAAGDKKMSGLRFDEILPGNHQGKAHVEDMDKDGIDVSVVYPAYAAQAYVMPDRELGIACMRSYNDWMLGEFQGASPSRIVGLPLLPVDDGMDVCLAEFDRCVRAGAKAILIPGLPVRPYHDRYYEPLYARASETGIPLTFHRTFGGRSQEADWDGIADLKITAGGTVWRFFSAVRIFTYLVYAGVFDRHPNLKIVAAEVNFGWLPFWLQTMDQNVVVRSELKDATLQQVKTPVEHMGTNLFVTILDDAVGFELVASHPWLADCAMWSSDYPHSVTLWPRSRQILADLAKNLRQDQLDQIAFGNAARVYGI